MRKRLYAALLLAAALFALPVGALASARALLVACSDFASQPDLGSAVSGNIHMIASALISSDMKPGDLSIEDGTIGTPDELRAAVLDAFKTADETDLSILYICTHGLLSSSDDGGIYLILGDGENEQPISASQLFDTIRNIQGEKLLILDACFSGALIGRGTPQQAETLPLDPSIHVLTSATGFESSWYYDSKHLSTGAVSYFASALSSGLGLYGLPEADLDGDSAVTLAEIHSYLSIAVPSSSSQLISANADAVQLPVARTAMLTKPLTGFSYGASLLLSSDPVLDFSFTVSKDNTGVQYRLIEYAEGKWDWENAVTFLDSGEGEDGMLSAGRKTRTLALEEVLPDDSGYLMLQIFSISSGEIILCSERLIGVQPANSSTAPILSCPDVFSMTGELPIDIELSVPAELTVTVYDQKGDPVRRIAAGRMTRPAPGSITRLYWDGRNDQGKPVSAGSYVITCETRIGGVRKKAAASIQIGI